MPLPQIIVVGSLNLDLVIRTTRFPGRGETVIGTTLERFCGGKGANQAYAAAKLGARVAMIGQVGNDDAGKSQISNLAEIGVDTSGIRRDPDAPTGTAIIALDESGENRILAVPGANGTFSPDKLASSESLLKSARILLLQLEVPIETVLKSIAYGRAANALIILDPAPAPNFPLPNQIVSAVDYLTPNLSELASLSGTTLDENSAPEKIIAAARVVIARGARKVLAKLGSRGVIIVTSNAAEHIPAFKVTPVDTTAAGDCFNAAFAVALSEGRPERDAVLFANAAAACSVTRMGAQPSMPTLSEAISLECAGKA